MCIKQKYIYILNALLLLAIQQEKHLAKSFQDSQSSLLENPG